MFTKPANILSRDFEYDVHGPKNEYSKIPKWTAISYNRIILDHLSYAWFHIIIAISHFPILELMFASTLNIISVQTAHSFP